MQFVILLKNQALSAEDFPISVNFKLELYLCLLQSTSTKDLLNTKLTFTCNKVFFWFMRYTSYNLLLCKYSFFYFPHQ